MRDVDVGLAAERTALAWQRSALSVVAAGAVVCKLAVPHIGRLAVVLFAASCVASAATLIHARRHRGRAQPCGASARANRSDGAMPMVLASALSVVAAMAVLTIALR